MALLFLVGLSANMNDLEINKKIMFQDPKKRWIRSLEQQMGYAFAT